MVTSRHRETTDASRGVPVYSPGS